jgi:uncharacterized protein (DUF697 family)
MDLSTVQMVDAQAQKIIQRQTLLSMGIGLIPLPGLDTAALLAQQLYMLKSLGQLYGQHLGDEIGKKTVLSLITALAPRSTLWVTASSVVKAVPLLGQTLSIFTSPLLAAGTTYALGQVFNKHFATGGTFLSFDPVKQRKFFQEQQEAGIRFAQGSRDPVRDRPAGDRPASATLTPADHH